MTKRERSFNKKIYALLGIVVGATAFTTIGILSNHSDNDTRGPLKNEPVVSKKQSKEASDVLVPKEESTEKMVKDTYKKYGIDSSEEREPIIYASDYLKPQEIQSVANVIREQQKVDVKESEETTPSPVPIPTPEILDPEPTIPPEQPVVPPVVISDPVIHYQAGAVVIKGSNFNPYNYFTVEDSLDAAVLLTIDVSMFTTETVGQQAFKVTATNKFGRTATATIPILVSSVPEISVLNQPIVSVIGHSFDPLSVVSAFDELSGDLSHVLQVTSSDVNTEEEGLYNVSFSVTNTAGVSSTATIKVYIKNEAPTITAPDVIHEINQEFDPLDNVTAVAFNGEIIEVTEESILENTVDSSTEGTYKVVYQVKDRFGKESERVERTVIVENEAPIVESEGMIFFEGDLITQENILSKLTITDREDDKLGLPVGVSIDLEQFSEIDTTAPGEYPLTITAVDSMEKATMITLIIQVKPIEENEN